MIRIVRAEPHHAGEMHLIEAEAFAAPWSEAAIREEISRKHSYVFAALGDDVVGHIYMRHILNEGHIINVAVRKPHRRRGIASRLLTALIGGAPPGLIGLTLEVRESNAAALALYEKHGFRPEGIRKNYYENPIENGIIMWKYFEVHS